MEGVTEDAKEASADPDAASSGSKEGATTVRRPMNAFLIFCKRHRSLVREKNPHLDNRSVTRILGELWANLQPEDKSSYTTLAKEYKEAFLKANPTYRWYNSERQGPGTAALKPATRPSNAFTTYHGQRPHMLDAITPGKLADPSNMGGLSLLLMAGQHTLTSASQDLAASRVRGQDSLAGCQNTPTTSASSQGPLADCQENLASCQDTRTGLGRLPEETNNNTQRKDRFPAAQGTVNAGILQPETRHEGQDTALLQLAEMCSAELCGQPDNPVVAMTPPWTPQHDGSLSPRVEHSPPEGSTVWDLSNQQREPAVVQANQREAQLKAANQREALVMATNQIEKPDHAPSQDAATHKFTELKIPVVKRRLTTNGKQGAESSKQGAGPSKQGVESSKHGVESSKQWAESSKQWAESSKQVVDRMIETVYVYSDKLEKEVAVPPRQEPVKKVCVIHSGAGARRYCKPEGSDARLPSPPETNVDLEKLLSSVPFSLGQIQETLIRKAMQDSYSPGGSPEWSAGGSTTGGTYTPGGSTSPTQKPPLGVSTQPNPRSGGERPPGGSTQRADHSQGGSTQLPSGGNTIPPQSVITLNPSLATSTSASVIVSTSAPAQPPPRKAPAQMLLPTKSPPTGQKVNTVVAAPDSYWIENLIHNTCVQQLQQADSPTKSSAPPVPPNTTPAKPHNRLEPTPLSSPLKVPRPSPSKGGNTRCIARQVVMTEEVTPSIGDLPNPAAILQMKPHHSPARLNRPPAKQKLSPVRQNLVPPPFKMNAPVAENQLKQNPLERKNNQSVLKQNQPFLKETQPSLNPSSVGQTQSRISQSVVKLCHEAVMKQVMASVEKSSIQPSTKNSVASILKVSDSGAPQWQSAESETVKTDAVAPPARRDAVYDFVEEDSIFKTKMETDSQGVISQDKTVKRRRKKNTNPETVKPENVAPIDPPKKRRRRKVEAKVEATAEVAPPSECGMETGGATGGEFAAEEVAGGLRKSQRSNRGTRYRELISQGLIQPTRSGTRKHDSSSVAEGDATNARDPELTATRRQGRRTMSETCLDGAQYMNAETKYRTGDFDLEAHIASLPPCDIKPGIRKVAPPKQKTRHHSESLGSATSPCKTTDDVTDGSGLNIAQLQQLARRSQVVAQDGGPSQCGQPVSVVGSRRRKARRHAINHLMVVNSLDGATGAGSREVTQSSPEVAVPAVLPTSTPQGAALCVSLSALADVALSGAQLQAVDAISLARQPCETDITCV